MLRLKIQIKFLVVDSHTTSSKVMDLSDTRNLTTSKFKKTQKEYKVDRIKISEEAHV